MEDLRRLIILLDELDGLVRPWTQGAFEIGVTVQCDKRCRKSIKRM